MERKADLFKRELKHKRIDPAAFVQIEKDPDGFQGYTVRKLSDITFPFILEKEPVILDFGDHYTGYLHMSLANGSDEHIADSPTNISFRFGEMPIEIAETAEDSPTSLSVGWLQDDFKTIAFMPYQGSLERRYSFRYLELKRKDSVRFPVSITELYVDSVSAVDISKVKPVNISDPLLAKIDAMCVKTLVECEQDVFEDGPKRDRRLWIGDLRLQALVDYETFQNIDLIKRCIYLFTEHLNNKGLVAPCVFPDTPPYVDQWFYLDYCLCLIPCLYDYTKTTGDTALAEELYHIALHQITYADSVLDKATGSFSEMFFIDHAKFDRTIAALGYFAYVTRQMLWLAQTLNKDEAYLSTLLAETEQLLLRFFHKEQGLFITPEGEISWHSQTWAALSGALSAEDARALLQKTAALDPQIRFSSPFMMHYYLEALYTCGLFDTMMDCIKDYWGGILNAGFDCCPECFQFGNDRLTPYGSPVLNSACHAWSCTPSYWIRKYYS